MVVVMTKCHIIVFLMILASHVHSYHTFSSTATITNAISSSLSSGITNYYHQHDGRRAFILSRSRLFSSESSSSSNSIDGGSSDSSAATKGFGKKKVPSVVDTEAVSCMMMMIIIMMTMMMVMMMMMMTVMHDVDNDNKTSY